MLWSHEKVGFLDQTFNIFDNHQHPVVIIGDQAVRWMAVGLMTNRYVAKFLVLEKTQKSFQRSVGLGLVSARWATFLHC